MKFVDARPLADPDVAARKIVELANAVEPYFDNRILIEKINGPFLYELRGTPAEYKAGLDRAIEKGWLVLHESGTFVKLRRPGRTCSPDSNRKTCLRKALSFSPLRAGIYLPAIRSSNVFSRADRLGPAAGKWCTHCKPGKGCAIHDALPSQCAEFHCWWRFEEKVPPHWKPDQAKMVITIHPGSGYILVQVDPSTPSAWRRQPYYDQLRLWAKRNLHRHLRTRLHQYRNDFGFARPGHTARTDKIP